MDVRVRFGLSNSWEGIAEPTSVAPVGQTLKANCRISSRRRKMVPHVFLSGSSAYPSTSEVRTATGFQGRAEQGVAQ